MNRFLNKKKAAASGHVWDDSSAKSISPPSSKDGKRWKRGKKIPEAPKLDLNLANVLPSDDNFRTSLLMPNLSARFSMLREQDDPNSKLGKAMDDSVLSPTRHSRLLDFGFGSSNGLTDIVEVASVSGSVRRPWLPQHQDSFASDEDYGTDNDSNHNGSIMSRSRPGEGNVLFGGRQKVYKIPGSSLGGVPRSASATSGLGKVVYDDDMHMSSFQKHKQQERDAAALDEVENMDPAVSDMPTAITGEHEETQPTTASPPRPVQNFSHSRKTSSHHRQPSAASSTTTAPSQARSSTPATSISSQPASLPAATTSPQPAKEPVPALPRLERSMTKRRLYEQGLDQHMYEQQASALTRLNSIQRQRTQGGKAPPAGLMHAKSVGNMQDRSHQPYAIRPQSPPGINPLTTFGSLRNPNSNGSSPAPSHPQSPTSPPLNDYDDFGVLSSALQPGDRGKATAMGAFNKPKQQFDEQQYLQRQMQLQQTRDTQASPDSLGETINDSKLARFDSVRQNAAIQDANRLRSRSSPAKPEGNKAFSVFQNAAAQIRTTQNESPRTSPVIPDTHRTFFGDISASDDDDEEEAGPGADSTGHSYQGGWPMGPSGRFNPSALSSVSEHPALRSQDRSFAEIQEEDEEDEDLPSIQPHGLVAPAKPLDVEVTLAPDTYMGAQESKLLSARGGKQALGGLVHQHLRNASVVSSAASTTQNDLTVPGAYHEQEGGAHSYHYANNMPKETSVPSLSDITSRSTRHTYSSENRVDSSYTNSNPWDLDDFDSSYYYGGNETSKSPLTFTETVKPRGHPLATDNTESDAVQEPSMGDGDAWNPGLKSQHTRDASTGTLLEREAFANELAARQKAIQENLRSIAEGQSRSGSPTPSTGGALKAFSMLKPKSSRESMSKQDASSKAMKMLGMGAGAFGANQTNTRGDEINFKRPGWTPAAGDSRQRAPSANSRPRRDSDASVYGQIPPRPSLSDAHAGQSRIRSSSVASSGRSISHTGRYRDDLTTHDARGATAPPMPSHPLTTRTSPELSQHQQLHSEASREGMGSNSKSDQAGYFETMNRQPKAHTPNNTLAPSGAPLPRSSPMASPYSANITPLTSAASTPTTHGPLTASAPISRPGALLRKKTVSKNEISEPTLISSTSNVDTVELPPGASLKNGMDEAPSLPPVNPRRRRTQKLFGFGRDGASEHPDKMSRPNSPPVPRTMAAFGRVRSPEPGAEPTESGAQVQRQQPRTMRSQESFETRFSPLIGSPPERPVMTEGGMF